MAPLPDGLDEPLSFLRICVFVEIQDDDIGAFLRKAYGDSSSDARIPSRDDGALAFEFA